MKNSIICPHCNSENAFYNIICTKCRYYLRDRIYNIDLWNTIISLIDNPAKSFRNIIFSEHKNFIYFILLFISAKYLINTRFLAMISVGQFQTSIELFFSYLIILTVVSIYFLLFTLVYTIIGHRTKIHIRFKDVFSIIIYSQVPFVLALVVLFPLELVIFGDYLFSMNPTPFTIKGNVAYLFLLVEISIVLWSIFLTFKAFSSHSRNRNLSLLVTISFIVLFWIVIYFCSVTIFTI